MCGMLTCIETSLYPHCSYLYSYRLEKVFKQVIPPPLLRGGGGRGGELSKPWRHGLRATHPLYLCGAGGWLAWIGGKISQAHGSSLELFTTKATLIKKKIKNFLICREIQNGAFAKSYMTNGLLIYGEIFAHFLIY
jgi:hypothetical protein